MTHEHQAAATSSGSTLIRTAADARALSSIARPMVQSPASFDGTLDELARDFILPNVPAPDAVTGFHQALVSHIGRADALFLLRALPGSERRKEYMTRDGTRFKATDNAPAWWVHATLLQGWRIDEGAFGDVVATMPAHFHEVARTCPPTAAAAGWHIAHIFDVNNRETDYKRFTRREVIRRFVRSVHPCNYFLLPTPEWRRWGSDGRVIGYFASLYSERYAAVWSEFLTLAEGDDRTLARSVTPISYSYAPKTVAPGTSESGIPEYRSTRLTFKRDVIEPLTDDERFRVSTPHGVFEMTKADLYEIFPGVPKSVSYRDRGVYHYSVVPRSALQFRMSGGG